MEPYTWQAEDIRVLQSHGFTGLLGLEPGAGKTLEACASVAIADPGTTLIIAPSSTIETPTSAWPKTMAAFDREVRLIGNRNKATMSALFDFQLGVPGVYATTPQFMTRKSTDTTGWSGDMLISDESHQLTTAKTTGQKKWSGYDHHDAPLSQRFDARLALSGTFFRQGFANAWATMRFLWPDLDSRDEVAYSNFYRWQQDRMNSKQVVIGADWFPVVPGQPIPEGAWKKTIDGVLHYSVTKSTTQYTEEKTPGLLISQMPCVIQHFRRSNCCEYHPNGFLNTDAPQIVDINVHLTNRQLKQIHELEDHLMTWIDGNPLVVDLTMIQKYRIRQLCLGEAYVDYYEGVDSSGDPVEKSRLEFSDDCVSPFSEAAFDILETLPKGEPVVIYMESQRFAHALTVKLNRKGFTAQEYSGKTKADLNKLGVDYQVLVGVISALGSGTDGLQERCHTEIVMETPISITNQEQVQARLDRLGGQQVQRYVIHDDTGYSEGRYSALLQKKLSVAASMRRHVVS